jgi:hypothetical protein
MKDCFLGWFLPIEQLSISFVNLKYNLVPQVSVIKFDWVLDINLMLQYSIEHDDKLRKSAPLFFDMCVPGLTEDYKMKVFY